MCRAGLLQRYTNDEDKKFRYYYKTTQKGRDVIRQAYNNPNLDVEKLCVMTKYYSQDSSYFKEINLNSKKNLVEAYALFDTKTNKVYVGNITDFKRLDELTFEDIKDFISDKEDAQKLFKLFGTLPRFQNCELRKFTFSIV
jgi:DNA-binding MarR family transcriptional regulator